MKKTLTVLLVLAIAMGSVFATDPTLVLTTTKTGETTCGFSSNLIDSFTTNPTAYAAETAYGNLTDEAPAYAWLKSNENKLVTYSVKSTGFVSATVGSKIGYSINVKGIGVNDYAAVTVASTATAQVLASGTLPKVTDGSAVAFGKSVALGAVTLDATDNANAVTATDYKATITWTVSAS